MDNDLNELIAGSGKQLSDKEYREIYAKIDEIKSNLGRLRYQKQQALKEVKKDNTEENRRKVNQLNDVINKTNKTRITLQAKVDDKFVIDILTKKLIFKKSTLRRSKNPLKLVEDKMRKTEIKQIQDEIYNNNLQQAVYLMSLYEAIEFETENKFLDMQFDRIKKTIENRMSTTKNDFLVQAVDEFLSQQKGKKYKLIITSSDNVLRIVKVSA